MRRRAVRESKPVIQRGSAIQGLYPARLRERSPAPESLLAWAAAFVGAIGIASALTPELANRYDLVKGVLPPGVPTAARAFALAFGVALVFVSRSLARRRRRAWQLAVAIVIASAVAHLAKGLDVEEAAVSLLLLAALLRHRRRFVVPGAPQTVQPLLVLVFGALAATSLTLGIELRGHELPQRLGDVFAAAGILAGFYALFLWLRPLSEAVAQTVGERRLARELVERYGRDSLSFFSLRRDKSFFFSPTRRAFLAYRVVGGAALVSGDPVGDEREFDTLLAEFRRVAHARGWRLAILGASSETLPHYRRLGMRPIPIGDEAVLRPAAFSLEGRAIRKVRQSVSRLTKAGYAFRVVAAEDVGAVLRGELDAVSVEWRGDQVERGFSMAMDDLFAAGTSFAVATAADGAVGGFLHLAPAPAGGAWSLSTMRRRRETPNGLTEFLVVETLLWAKECGAAEVSLNFCALADFLSPERATTVPRRLVRRGLLAADNVFQLERLHSFSRKFHPEWRTRYLCVERLADLPLVGLAYLRVEQLLTPPARWRRRVPVSH
jgi:lysyl-tRNA synthetase, class II